MSSNEYIYIYIYIWLYENWFESILEWENQEDWKESFSSFMHWDLWKVVYNRSKVLGQDLFFGNRAGIRRQKRMVGKAECTFGEGSWKE